MSRLLLAACVLALTGCATSPTGRPQLLLIPQSQIAQMGVAAYQETKKNTPISSDTRTNHYVNCVANAITREVTAQTDWEVTVFEDKAVNAFALPGGKIGVYTGLLEVAENQDQLAAVIGHEVGHVLANHGNARVSAAYATQGALLIAQIAAIGASREKQQLMGLLGVGTQFGILLPYGRSQESEADIIGLELMAKAGFNPEASTQLWRNMAKESDGKQPPEFMSTHPSHERRIRDLNAGMLRAVDLYQDAEDSGKVPNCQP